MSNKILTTNSIHLLFVLDFLVSPLLKIGVGIRLSYIVLLFLGPLCIYNLFNRKLIDQRFLLYVCITILSFFATVVFSFSSQFTTDSVFMVISFFFALSSFSIASCFPSRIDKYIVPLFFIVCSVNLVFAFLTPYLPDFFLSVYYNSSSLSDSSLFSDGISSIRKWYRPLGPQGGPTYSALSVTLVYAFLVFFVKKNLIAIKSLVVRIFCIFLPLAITLRYSSRTEFLACLLFSAVLIHFYLSPIINKVFLNYYIKVLLYCFIPIFLFFSYFLYLALIDVASNQFESWAGIDFDRFLLLLSNPLANNSDGDLRLFGFFSDFFPRFAISPVVGSGIFHIDAFQPIKYYHNDFFFFTAISGIIGLLFYIFFLWKISRLSYILIIPLVFSGLTNSFFFCFPVVGAYFFLLSQTINLFKSKSFSAES